jgi:flagellar biosynthetic protein FliR
MLAVFLRMTADAFLFGLKASAPVLAALLMSSLGLAVTARIMPQMNVWLVGMPLKLLLGLVTVVYALPVLWMVFQKHFHAWVEGLGDLIRLMGGR